MSQTNQTVAVSEASSDGHGWICAGLVPKTALHSSLGVYYMEEKGVECTRLGMLRSTRRKETHLIRLTTKITDTNHAVLECGILLGYCTIHFHSCDNVLDVLAHCSLNGLFFLFFVFCVVCFVCIVQKPKRVW